MEFLALYAGEQPTTSRILAITADRDLVESFASEMLRRPATQKEDPVIAALEDGKRRALRLVATKVPASS